MFTWDKIKPDEEYWSKYSYNEFQNASVFFVLEQESREKMESKRKKI